LRIVWVDRKDSEKTSSLVMVTAFLTGVVFVMFIVIRKASGTFSTDEASMTNVPLITELLIITVAPVSVSFFFSTNSQKAIGNSFLHFTNSATSRSPVLIERS